MDGLAACARDADQALARGELMPSVAETGQRFAQVQLMFPAVGVTALRRGNLIGSVFFQRQLDAFEFNPQVVVVGNTAASLERRRHEFGQNECVSDILGALGVPTMTNSENCVTIRYQPNTGVTRGVVSCRCESHFVHNTSAIMEADAKKRTTSALDCG